MNLPRVSVQRPVTALMAVAVVFVLGFVSFRSIPMDLFPKVEFPVAAVSVTYEGAGPREVENLVTKPIEKAIATVSSLKSMRSRSSRGRSLVVAEFEWGTDMDFATLEMRERIDRIRRQLPEAADEPLVIKFDPNQAPVMALTVGGSRPPAELRALADDVIVPRLERLDGVASVNVSGGLKRQIQVVVDPARLQAHQVSLDAVVQALGAENTSMPGGTLRQGPREFLVSTEGEFRSLDDVAELRVPSAAGSPVPLGFLASVRDTYEDVTVINRLDFKPSVGLSLQKESQANTVQVSRRVRQELERLQGELGPDVEMAVVFDQAEFIERSIRSVVENAVVGAVLAGVVLLLFLQNLRATLVVIISIPVAAVATLVLMYLTGMTLNLISMGGLALGVGMMVDNAIVVLESIYRHRTRGGLAEEAAVEGANEVRTAISASTFTSIVVFAPVLFVGGIVAQIFRDLALTNSVALLASLGVALTMSPLLASRLLRGRWQSGNGEQGLLGRPGRAFLRLYGSLEALYGRSLPWALRHRAAVVAIAAATFALSLVVLPGIGSEFMPEVDPGAVRVRVELPTGTRLEETNRVVARLESAVAEIPEVATIYSSAGSGASQGMAGLLGSAPEVGSIDVELVERSRRTRRAQDVAEAIRGLGRQIPGATVSARVQQGFGGGFTGSGIEVRLRGEDEERMARLLEQVKQVVQSVPGTREVETSLEEQRPQYSLVVDRQRARQLGLSLPQIASVVRTALSGTVATRYRTAGTEIDLLVRADPAVRENLSLLQSIPVLSPVAGVVPLGDLVVVSRGATPRTLQRQDQARVMSVTALPMGRPLGEVVAAVQRAVSRLEIPSDLQVSYAGEAERMREAFGSLGLAMVLAIFLVYAVMAAQFESLIQPLIIMLSVPLAAVGVTLGLSVTGNRLNVGSILGLIMLAGIVVNNAIVLVDYVNTLRKRGLERDAALVEAGRVRLRPILMTTLTTVLGMLPLAVGRGEGSEVQAPLAVTIIFGLLSATLLTLVVIPTIYSGLEDLGAALGAAFRRRPAPGLAARPAGEVGMQTGGSS